MNASRPVLRSASQLPRLAGTRRQLLSQNRRHGVRFSSTSSQQAQRGGGKVVGFATVFVAAAAAAYYLPQVMGKSEPQEVERVPTKAELEFEKPRQAPVSKEDHRDLLSSQHLQVKNSWENPGVYAWGSNEGKVIDPTSKEKYIKLPRRVAYFNNQLLRDLKLTQAFGAAITENGDLVQWGIGFSKSDPTPRTTLKGKDLVKIDVSADRIVALSRKGTVFSIPSSSDDQQDGTKQERQGSTWSFWSSSGGKEKINFRDLTPSSLGRGEAITDISSGLEHCLLLTSKGRVFSAASSATKFPSKGQMGIPGLSWETRPPGPYDQAHEIITLKGFQVQQIATGDHHSAILDKEGRVFAFGDNSVGQLGFEARSSMLQSDAPAMVGVNSLYAGTGAVPKVTSVAAGGTNTFFTVDAQAPQSSEASSQTPAKIMPRVVADLWAAGQGIAGTLGTGKWTHVSTGPSKVKSLSSLFEFDENKNAMTPIKLKHLSIGSTHCAAVMDNVTQTSVNGKSSEHETNWGSDILFWGGNEYYQLGTGKRTNLNAPSYIGPLDGGDGDAEKGRKGEVHRMCLTPRQTVRLGEDGKGRKVTLEQKVDCGQLVTGVYSSV